MDDRETNPRLGFKSKASIPHAPAGTQTESRDSWQSLATPWTTRQDTVRVSGGYRGEPPTHPLQILAFPLARAPNLRTNREGARESATIIACACPTIVNGAR